MSILIQQGVNAIALASIYALVAVAFTIMIGILNFLNFTVGVLMMTAGVIVGLTIRAGHGWAAAIILSFLAVAVTSLVIERFTYRYLKPKFGDATEHVMPLVSSLGFVIVLQNLAIIVGGSKVIGVPSPFPVSDFHIGSIVIGIPQLISLILSAAFVSVLAWLVWRTKLGRALRATAENPEVTTMLGINTERIVPAVFIITGALSGLAGVLFSVTYLQASAFMGDDITVKALAAVVIGGLGNVWGAVIGSVVIALLQVATVQFYDAEIARVVLWGGLFLILLFRPSGILGRPSIGKGKF